MTKTKIILMMLCMVLCTAALFSGCGKDSDAQSYNTGAGVQGGDESARALLKEKYSVSDDILDTTGSYRWKLVIEQEGGLRCCYGGYTRDMSALPKDFNIVRDAVLRASSRDTSSPSGVEDECDRSVLAEELGCGEITAQNIRHQLEDVTGKRFLEWEFNVFMDDSIRFLKSKAEDGAEYYAELEKGYFISAVYEGSPHGTCIYTAYR